MESPLKKPAKDLAEKVAQHVIHFLHSKDMQRLNAFIRHFEDVDTDTPICEYCRVPFDPDDDENDTRRSCASMGCEAEWCGKPWCTPSFAHVHTCSSGSKQYTFYCSAECLEEASCPDCVNHCNHCARRCTMCYEFHCNAKTRVCENFQYDNNDNGSRWDKVCDTCYNSMRRMRPDED